METKTSKHSGVRSNGKPQRAASGVTHTLEGILSIHPGTHPLDPFRSAKESREVNFSSLVYNAVNSSGRAAMPAAVGAAERMARPDARSQLAGLLVINAFTEPPRRAVAYATVDSPATTAPKTNDPAVPHNCTTGRCASAAARTCRVVHVKRRPKQSATSR